MSVLCFFTAIRLQCSAVSVRLGSRLLTLLVESRAQKRGVWSVFVTVADRSRERHPPRSVNCCTLLAFEASIGGDSSCDTPLGWFWMKRAEAVAANVFPIVLLVCARLKWDRGPKSFGDAILVWCIGTPRYNTRRLKFFGGCPIDI